MPTSRRRLVSLVATLAPLAACTGQVGTDPGGGGGDACTLDTDCATGFECTPAGECVAVPDAGEPLDCPDVTLRFEPLTPTVVLLIDQSGSMTGNFAGLSRWDAVKQALVDPTAGVVKQLESRVIFGATLYSSLGGNAGGTCPMLVEQPPKLDNYADIAALLGSHQPQADTPTAESVAAVRAGFPQPDPEKPAPRILVLATDGNPDNCVDSDAHDLGSQNMSELQVQTTFAAGIQTYVLSVGDDVAQPHLQRLANAGVGLPMNTGTAPYYVANDPTQLVDAFNAIIRGARVCTFTIDGEVNLADASEGQLELNGQPLSYGTDWIMVDGSTLELLGAACDTFLDLDTVLLEGEFPCGAVVL